MRLSERYRSLSNPADPAVGYKGTDALTSVGPERGSRGDDDPFSVLTHMLRESQVLRLARGASPRKDPRGNLEFSSIPMYKPQCKMDCQCPCHRGNRLRSPQVLENLIGPLTVNQQIQLSRSKSCVSSNCHSSFRASFIFPRWLLHRSLDFESRSSRDAGPQVTLKAPKYCPESAPIFWAARTGALTHIHELFLSGQASSSDVSYFEGKSALHVSHPSGTPNLAAEYGADCCRSDEH